MNNNTITVFTFKPYFDGYYCNHQWFDASGRAIRVRHYNGRNCLQVGRKRYGIRKLRAFAKKEVKRNLTTTTAQ